MTGDLEIYAFSGTGNTRFVARLLEGQLRTHGAEVTFERMEEVVQSKGAVPAEKAAVLGVGFPVHGFGAPRIVFDFVKRLPPGAGRRAFLFITAADVVSINRAAAGAIARRLERKGYDLFHESLFPMPANIGLRYPDSLSNRLCARAGEEARRIAEEILAGRPRRSSESALLRLTARAVNACEHLGARLLGKHLKASSACTLCGACVRDCPAENIREAGKRIRFGWRCLGCFRCVYHCPVGAISPRGLGFLVLKDGYDIERMAAAPDPDDGFFSRRPGWLYKRLVAHVRER